jgi:hypothetical protein
LSRIDTIILASAGNESTDLNIGTAQQVSQSANTDGQALPHLDNMVDNDSHEPGIETSQQPQVGKHCT